MRTQPEEIKHLQSLNAELLGIVKKLDAAARASTSTLEFSQMCGTFIQDARAAH